MLGTIKVSLVRAWMAQTYGIGKESQPGLQEFFLFFPMFHRKSFFPQTMDEEPYEMRKYIHLCILCVSVLQHCFCLESFLTNLSLLPSADLLGLRIVSNILNPLKIFPFI